MDSLCHPWFTTTKLSYRFPIFETSATALCGTTGMNILPNEASIRRFAFPFEDNFPIKHDLAHFICWVHFFLDEPATCAFRSGGLNTSIKKCCCQWESSQVESKTVTEGPPQQESNRVRFWARRRVFLGAKQVVNTQLVQVILRLLKLSIRGFPIVC